LARFLVVVSEVNAVLDGEIGGWQLQNSGFRPQVPASSFAVTGACDVNPTVL
jgi:hypothetical protein